MAGGEGGGWGGVEDGRGGRRRGRRMGGGEGEVRAKIKSAGTEEMCVKTGREEGTKDVVKRLGLQIRPPHQASQSPKCATGRPVFSQSWHWEELRPLYESEKSGCLLSAKFGCTPPLEKGPK